MDASGCRNYETVKDSPSYLIGVMDGMAKKKTNADRIRSMSDEELLSFLLGIGINDGCPPGCPDVNVQCDGDCRRGIAIWLGSHAKED